jgi:hypothetical protein
MSDEVQEQEQPEKVQNHLPALLEDYRRVTGVPFRHFYCPILHKDEDTKLCMGHIVNQKIDHSCRKAVVQRHDVDSFYGRVVEREFINFNALRGSTIEDVLLKKDLRKRIHPRITADGQECEYYRDKGHKARDQTRVILETPGGKEVKLILKMEPANLRAAASKRWQIAVEGDYRLSALVSMIKAAYLTLFSMLGYRYALSAAGLAVGYDILGRFYLENCDKGSDEVTEEAVRYFSQYVHMLRPMHGLEEALPQGTIEDNRLTVCYSITGQAFAAVVCVRTNAARHAVLMPLFEDHDMAMLYWEFLQSERENETVARKVG